MVPNHHHIKPYVGLLKERYGKLMFVKLSFHGGVTAMEEDLRELEMGLGLGYDLCYPIPARILQLGLCLSLTHRSTEPFPR